MTNDAPPAEITERMKMEHVRARMEQRLKAASYYNKDGTQRRNSTFVVEVDDVVALLAAEARLAEVEKENRRLTGAPDPRAFDLNQWADWLRLLRETRGYMHTCWRQHDGGDRKGRFFAEDALKEMEAKLEAYVTNPSPSYPGLPEGAWEDVEAFAQRLEAHSTPFEGRKKPTIAELEVMLKDPPERVEMLPDGSIEVAGILKDCRNAAALIRRQASALAGARSAALEEAAKVCEKRTAARQEEFGSVEWDTNAFNYPHRQEDLLHSLDEEDDDCAAAIRALGTPAEKEK